MNAYSWEDFGALNATGPLETTYKGIRFRSRLEARWAVVFDALRIVWQYESQGFLLQNGQGYLPDFYLPDSGTWVEVKGSDHGVDWALVDAAVGGSLPLPGAFDSAQSKVLPGVGLLLLGPVPVPVPGFRPTHLLMQSKDEALIPTAAQFIAGVGAVGSQPWVGPLSINAQHTPQQRAPRQLARVHQSYSAGRSARFDHGQSGTWLPFGKNGLEW